MKTPEKKKVYKSKYQNGWEIEFTWVTKSEKGNSFAFCKLCQRHFSVSHAGKNDVKKHGNTDLHSRSLKTSKHLQSVSDFVVTKSDQDVIRAETLFSNFIAEHNLPFLIADHLNKLCKKMFPDSKIAQKFSCGRTKASQIVKRAIAPCINKRVVEICQSQPFSLSIDESNDKNAEKNLVILLRVYDQACGMAVTRLLDMPICNIGNAEAIFNKVDEALSSRAIPWENLVSFVSDNCSVMIGRKNSVLSRIKEKKPDVFDLGCVCHLANLCAVAGIKALEMPVEDLLIDIFYHFNQSSKRKETYKEYMDFCDIEPLQILKHVTTRWLSLQKCVTRILHHWASLKSYFNSHEDVEKEGRVKRAAFWLNSEGMKLVYHFLSFILGPLNEFNTAFQADSSKIGFLAPEMTRLLRKFLMKFILARVVRECDKITEVDFQKLSNQHTDELLAVGATTRTYLHDIKDTVDPAVTEKFFRSVRKFYSAVVEKFLKKFPFDEPLLQHLGFLDPDMKDTLTADSVVIVAKRFPMLIPEDKLDDLAEEYRDFQAAPNSELPNYKKDITRIDQFWGELALQTNKMTGKQLYPLLSKIGLAMVIIPNSNADCERTFSMVRKVQTELRSDLENDTLCALLSCKINQQCPCFSFDPSCHMLNLAKTATNQYNSSLQKDRLLLPSTQCYSDIDSLN